MFLKKRQRTQFASARYARPDIVEAILETGEVIGFPVREKNIIYRDFLEWIEEGNTAEPYIAPSEPEPEPEPEKIPETTEKKLERLTGISMKELRRALKEPKQS